MRIAPDCRTVGTLRVRGRRGLNRIRFRGRVHGRPLAEGTYVVRARNKQTKVVIFDRQPSRAELAAARASNTCGAPAGDAAADGTVAFGSGAAGASKAAPRASVRNQPIAVDKRSRPSAAGVLGVRFDSAGDAVKNVPLTLYVLLGIAIALLALAAVPVRWVPNARLASTLAYRGRSLTLAGAVALGVVAVAYLLV